MFIIQPDEEGKKYIFTRETVESLCELGKVLQRIHNRLISEGCIIKDGKVYKPGEKPHAVD